MNELTAEAAWPPERIDADYNARATVGDRFAEEMRAYRERSDEVRGPYLSRADLVYDAESGQTLDLFGLNPQAGPQPVFVFIHGGYWRALSKRDSAMMAGMLAERGIATAVIDYRLAPQASLAEIVREVRAAIAFLWREGRMLGLDPERIHVGGSSAGGHLAAMLAAGGWQAAFGLPDNAVKSALLLSGLFELAPIASFTREWLALDEADVAALSPLRHLPREGYPVAIVWAQGEAPGFKRQSTAFHRAWLDAGFPAQALEVPGRNHFDILMELRDPETALSRLLLELIEETR